MTHNFPVPDEARMETLIAASYEAMPVADRQSLMRIEERLPHRLKTRRPEQKSNKIAWWIVLLLAAGFATAAWWAGGQWFKEPEMIPEEILPSGDVRVKEHDFEPSGPDLKPDKEIQENNTYEDKKSPVIYQREDF